MVVDFRRAQSDHSPLNINVSNVEIIKSTKFLGVHLVENMSSITKKAQQHLYFLRRLKKAHLQPLILTTFYRGTIKSILSSCITAWFGNCTVSDHKTLQWIISLITSDSVNAEIASLPDVKSYTIPVHIPSSVQSIRPPLATETIKDSKTSPAHGSSCYRCQRTTVTGYFASYGSSGATGDYRSARSADPLLSRSGGSATEPTPQHKHCHPPTPTGPASSVRALDWPSTVWDADPQIRTLFTYFAGMIREVFEHPAEGKDISLQLMELRQGSDLAANYANKFCTLAAQSGWNDVALWAVFHEGLSPALQTELACWEDATSLSQYVATAIRLDNLLHQHRTGARPPVLSHPRLRPDYPRPREEAPEPMQLGRSRLMEREHQRHAQMRLCYYCGGSGHLIHPCPEKPSSVQVGENSLFFSLTVPVSFCFSDLCDLSLDRLRCRC
ncbi:hypothetical protein QTP86_007939 [Hemibagrus guttatus]|nr:hypothetical protein QTP86_007939 [Hemibagrus guttatus]